jgi:transposase InsO family protein
MLLHLDGSSHAWFQDHRRYDLLVILDDATNEIYYAQLVEEECTATVMTALREVIERKGAFCSLYSDRASHFFYTPKAGQPVDRHRPTQVGRAMAELGIQMIPAYSPQARGRGERNFGTWQGRLPQELRLQGIHSVAGANEFLRESYLAECNRRFAIAATQPGHAFLPVRGKNLDLIFSLQHERTVNQDNTVHVGRPMHAGDREDPLASHTGRRPGHHLRTAGWNLDYRPRPPHRGTLQPGRITTTTRNHTAAQTSGETGVATLLSSRLPGIKPTPDTQPKPDTSCAMKSGHFNC